MSKTSTDDADDAPASPPTTLSATASTRRNVPRPGFCTARRCATRVTPPPPTCPPEMSHLSLRGGGADAPTATAPAAAKRVSATQRTSAREVRAPFIAEMVVRETDDGGPSPSNSNSKSNSKTVTASEEIELRRQRAIQEGLTDEMSELASGLRANALALERGLGRSSAALTEVEARLERNVDVARASAWRQTKAYRENGRGSCWTWIVLALVGVLFAWTYVVIKMSSVRVRR